MIRSEQLDFLIRELMPGAVIPKREADKWTLFRSLANIRRPGPVSEAFLEVQDAFLKTETMAKGITRLKDLQSVTEGKYLWQGDITTLAVDAIVNAANSGMTGCYCPCHGCIDNAIHTYAGVQLRNACAEIMKKQGYPEPTGHAKITDAYNLPSKYIIHTVGPIVNGPLTDEHRQQLAECYRACLKTAKEAGLHSIAFCCISTGEFHFPNKEAAEIALKVSSDFLAGNTISLQIIFNVFNEKDYMIYRHLLK